MLYQLSHSSVKSNAIPLYKIKTVLSNEKKGKNRIFFGGKDFNGITRPPFIFGKKTAVGKAAPKSQIKSPEEKTGFIAEDKNNKKENE